MQPLHKSHMFKQLKSKKMLGMHIRKVTIDSFDALITLNKELKVQDARAMRPPNLTPLWAHQLNPLAFADAPALQSCSDSLVCIRSTPCFGFEELQQHSNMRHTKHSQGTPLVALMQTFFTKTLQFASAMAAKEVVESSQLDTLPSEDL